MNDLFARVVEWNAERYKQEENIDLTANLLYEEVNEYYGVSENTLTNFTIAPEEVERLDALMDTMFVAIGAAWKMGLSSHQIEEAFKAVCDANDTKTIEKTPSYKKANVDKGRDFLPPEPRLQEILDDR